MWNVTVEVGWSTGVHTIRLQDDSESGRELSVSTEGPAGGFLLDALRSLDFLLWESPVALWRADGWQDGRGESADWADSEQIALLPYAVDEFQFGIVDAGSTVETDAPPHDYYDQTFGLAEDASVSPKLPANDRVRTRTYLEAIVTAAESCPDDIEGLDISERGRGFVSRYLEDARDALEYDEKQGTLSGFAYDRTFEEIDDYVASERDDDTRLNALLSVEGRVTDYLDRLAERDEEWVEQRYVDLLARDDPVARAAVAHLRANPDPRAKQGLFTMVWIDSPDQAPTAIRALGAIGDAAVTREVTNALEDSAHAAVRQAAAEVLGELQADDASDTLSATAEADPDPDVRQAATDALNRLDS